MFQLRIVSLVVWYVYIYTYVHIFDIVWYLYEIWATSIKIKWYNLYFTCFKLI